MDKNDCGVVINKEVVAQIAGIAAMEVEGIVSTSSKPLEFKNVIKGDLSLAPVNVTTDNGVILIDAYLKISESAKVREVAEKVQLNIKEKVQNMTGNAVAKVDVHICDIVDSTSADEE